MSDSFKPQDCSTTRFPVYHQLPELTQTHVHGVSDAFQPSDPLASPSPPTFNLPQHQGLFKRVSSSHQVAKLLQLVMDTEAWLLQSMGSQRVGLSDWTELNFVTPWTAAHQASLSITNSQSLLKLMSIESVMPPNHLILCRPLLPPTIFPSIRVFSNESVLRIKWPKD